MKQIDRSICAVVPAAGRGSRLGLNQPKILAPLGYGRSILSVLCRKLLVVADHVNLIVSPDGYDPISEVVEREGFDDQVTLSIQPEPSGMGDAIFRGYPVWSRARSALIVWGDQVFVSLATLRRACALHAGDDRTVVIPVVAMSQPYVEYIFDAERLIAVKQSREGDSCSPGGYSDIGTFVLSVADLHERWESYRRSPEVGGATGEINFLPFLPYLSASRWDVRRFVIDDEREARGINTAQDLAFFQSIMSESNSLEGLGSR
ncbi:MAG TPA: NTP transferase domain-containing protein [Candidatus Binataceae bacterium]|nr:NTP transferase domain-containing protein [Candidatus Binataceae bacterium]